MCTHVKKYYLPKKCKQWNTTTDITRVCVIIAVYCYVPSGQLIKYDNDLTEREQTTTTPKKLMDTISTSFDQHNMTANGKKSAVMSICNKRACAGGKQLRISLNDKEIPQQRPQNFCV